MTDDIDIRTQVDRRARRFLAAVQYYGGDATTTEIRQRTGLSREETDWRFRKLDDLDLIDVSRAETGRGDREPPRVAKMTGKARAEIERGLLYDIDSTRTNDEINDLKSEIRSLRADIERVENKLDAATEGIHGLDNEVEGMQHWADDVESILTGLRDALEAQDIDPDDAIRAQMG